MPEYLDDPSVLTKEKLKNELLANNVELPSGNPTKDVYVQLYLKNLTALNKKTVAVDTFSSDEDLPLPVVSNRSRSSGRKATKKTDKAWPQDLDVTDLTAEGLKDELLKYGVDAGPIVASTRKLYEKKLQTLLQQGPPEALVPQTDLAATNINHNGNSDTDLYSDKEEVPEHEPEPEPEPESIPTPVVDQPQRSCGKVPVTTRSRSSQHNRVEKIAAIEQTSKVVDDSDILKKLFPSEVRTPTGITATCRRPIHGAAPRPVTSGDLWSSNSLLLRIPKSSNTTSTSSYTETRTVHRVNALCPSVSHTSSSSTRLAATPLASQTKASCHGLSLWIKLLLLVAIVAFLFFVYQTMETDAINPFGGSDEPQIAADSPIEQPTSAN